MMANILEALCCIPRAARALCVSRTGAAPATWLIVCKDIDELWSQTETLT